VSDDAEKPAKGDAEKPAKGDAEKPAKGDAEKPAKGDAEKPAKGDAEKPAKGGAEKRAKGEAEKSALEDTDVIKRDDEEKSDRSKQEREKARRDAIARVLADDDREGKREKKRASEDDEEPRGKGRRNGLADALGIEAAERPPSKWRRRFVYLLVLGTASLVCWILSVRNHDRFYLVCLPDRIEPQRGNQWPWGRDPIGGEAYAAVKIPAEADCRERAFTGQEGLDHALADLLVGRIEAEVRAGNAKLDEVAARLTQAQLLTRGRPDARARLQTLAADLSYLRGRAGVDQAAASLRAAINHLKEAKLRGAANARDADLWIEHLERLLPSLASPRVAPALPALPAPAAPAPASAPGQPKAAPAGPARDAGVPAPPPGGVLM
jgi:hypothetical protein